MTLRLTPECLSTKSKTQASAGGHELLFGHAAADFIGASMFIALTIGHHISISAAW